VPRDKQQHIERIEPRRAIGHGPSRAALSARRRRGRTGRRSATSP
jgi:hypothetical protein